MAAGKNWLAEALKLIDENPSAAQRTVELLAGIGQVVSGRAHFEMALDDAAIRLGRIPQAAGLCLTSQIAGPARKFAAYATIARLRGADAFDKELSRFAQTTVGIAERRNRVVHDPWFVLSLETPHRMEITAKKVLRSELVEVTPEAMMDLSRT